MSNKHFMPARKDRIKKADQLIRYFESFSDSGYGFRLGLYMSMQWRRYLIEEHPELSELKRFVNALDGGGGIYGSGFYELEIEVKQWVHEIELG